MTTTRQQRIEQSVVVSLHTAQSTMSQFMTYVLIGQWVLSLLFALFLAPLTWEGANSSIHSHVWVALGIGALLTIPPVMMIRRAPADTLTIHAVAIAQMSYSALLIHLSGGRIETHFHIFASLAFLSAYKDWRVVATGTVVVVLDHLGRGLFFPFSIFGLNEVSILRIAEHALWVVFEDIVLVKLCFDGMQEIRRAETAKVEAAMAQEQAETLREEAEELLALQKQAQHEIERVRVELQTDVKVLLDSVDRLAAGSLTEHVETQRLPL